MIEKLARRIMAKMKGFNARAMKDDERDYPEAFAFELKWLMDLLKKNGVKDERK